jgi:hypothetical protein
VIPCKTPRQALALLAPAAVLAAAAFLPGPRLFAAAAADPADLVLRGGVVYTVDAARSWAQALAVKEGRLV